MARKKMNPSDDYPQEDDKFDRTDENFSSSDDDQNTYSSDEDEISEIWKSSSRRRRRRSEPAEPARQDETDAAADPSDEDASAPRSYRGRSRRSFDDDSRWNRYGSRVENPMDRGALAGYSP